MANGVWGLDVSPTSLKAVQLSGSGESPVIETIERISFDIVSPDDDQKMGPHVQEGLSEFAAKHDLSGSTVAASLPSHTTFNRFISLPPVEEERIQEIVEYEAQQHIPFELDDVIWSYEHIERDYGPGEEREVILFAIKQDLVNRFINILETAGIQVDIVQFSPVALYNFIQYDQPVQKTTAVLDIGENNCDLLIIEEDRYWIRNVPLAASDFTEALQDKLKLEYDKAEVLKKKAGKSKKAKQYYQIMQPVLRDLVQEIHRSVGFYKSMSEGSQLDQVLLTGGGAKTLKLKNFVSENLQLPASMLSEFRRFQVSEEVERETVERETPTLGPALGLGVQAFGASENTVNLIPRRIKKQKKLEQKRPYVIAACAIFALAVGLWYMAGSRKIDQIKSLNNSAEKIITEAKDAKKKIDKARDDSRRATLKSVLEQAISQTKNRQLPITLWKELVNALPDNVQIRNKLNKAMVPYYRQAGGGGWNQEAVLDYEEFRTASMDKVIPAEKQPNKSLKQLMKKVQNDVRKHERKFIWLLDVRYNMPETRNGAGGQSQKGKSSFELDIGVVTRGEGEIQKDQDFVDQNLVSPLREAFDVSEDETYISVESDTVSRLSQPEQDEEGRRRNSFRKSIFRRVTVRIPIDPEKM